MLTFCYMHTARQIKKTAQQAKKSGETYVNSAFEVPFNGDCGYETHQMV